MYNINKTKHLSFSKVKKLTFLSAAEANKKILKGRKYEDCDIISALMNFSTND